MAGAAGLEPAVPVLETGGLPLTDAPLTIYCLSIYYSKIKKVIDGYLIYEYISRSISSLYATCASYTNGNTS